MPTRVAAKQNSTNLGRKSCRMSTLPMSRNSMSGNVTLKVSLSDALQNAGGRKPSCPSAYPTTMTRNTGRVAFRLKIKFCMAVLPFFCCLYSTIPNKSLQGRDFAKSFFGKSLDFSGVFVLEYLLQSMQQAEVLESADRHV